MNETLERLKTLFTAAPTWLVLAAAIVVEVRDSIAEVFPGIGEDVAGIAAPILAVLAVAVLIVRRVTTVIKADRGLLPVVNPTPLNTQAPGPMDGGA